MVSGVGDVPKAGGDILGTPRVVPSVGVMFWGHPPGCVPRVRGERHRVSPRSVPAVVDCPVCQHRCPLAEVVENYFLRDTGTEATAAGQGPSQVLIS